MNFDQNKTITPPNNQITILFEPGTNRILNMINMATGESYMTNKLKLKKWDVYEWAKSIKPSPGEFNNLSSLLMAIKNQTPNNEIKYQFSNNGNFLTEYLLGIHSGTSINFNKNFWISYNTLGRHHALNITYTIKFTSTNINNSINTYNTELPTNPNTFEHIRHELLNPLNAIKISGDQIRKHIRKTNGNISTDDIDKFNNIIINQVDNSIDIINTFTKFQNQQSNNNNIPSSVSFQKISIPDFKKYIQSHIEQINQTYFMFPPIQIDWQINEICQSDYIIIHYVCISLSYMKIILDNIFRNIYGHLPGDLKSIHQNIYNNKFVISFLENRIELKIYNEIQPTDKIFTTEMELKNNQSTQIIINKYDLFISNLSKKTTTESDINLKHNAKHNSRNNRGIGLTLISNLCQKMDVKWRLIDDINNICFTLSIPLVSDIRPLPLFCCAVNNINRKPELITF